MSEIIPFGKYKGQPIEAMAGDTQYLDWLLAQPWFRDKFSNAYTLIVNNFQQPSETPEHNAMQALFLDEGFCQKLANILGKNHFDENYIKRNIGRTEEKLAEKIKEKTIAPEWILKKRAEEYDKKITEYTIELEKLKEARQIESKSRGIVFEKEGKDIIFYYSVEYNEIYKHDGSICIELKPQVGDDYPAILRQMNATKSDTLILKEYIGMGATQAQFIKIFEISKIRVIFLREII